MKTTGLLDSAGQEIFDGDMVSLGPNITADDSMGALPNGWTFYETDIHRVYFDERIKNWSLDLGVEPDSPLNRKFMNHAVSLLHGKAVKIVGREVPL